MSFSNTDSPGTGVIELPVTRTARVAVAGKPTAAVRELWMVIHGYGQLAPLFIRHFAALADGTRWILAPEALSRFYHEMPDAVKHGNMPPEQRRVGASWLTREERDQEIADSVGYLDSVYRMSRVHLSPDFRLVVLGFSQGVSVACRWLAYSELKPRVEHLICWSGSVPMELESSGKRIQAARATLVVGDEDPWVSSEVVALQQERLTAVAVEPRVVMFSGGHRMDAPTLESVISD